MACDCNSKQFEQLKIQVHQHELTIAQLVEIMAHTNRLVSELTLKQKIKQHQ